MEQKTFPGSWKSKLTDARFLGSYRPVWSDDQWLAKHAGSAVKPAEPMEVSTTPTENGSSKEISIEQAAAAEEEQSSSTVQVLTDSMIPMNFCNEYCEVKHCPILERS